MSVDINYNTFIDVRMIEGFQSPSESKREFSGESTVVTREGNLKKILIKKSKQDDNVTFTAFLEDSTKVGHVEFFLYDPSEETDPGFQKTLSGYGREETGCRRIEVVDLQSPMNAYLKGVGTSLLQAVMEYSHKKKCDGRIILTALPTSHFFYYTNGFRSSELELDLAYSIDMKMASLYQNAKVSSEERVKYDTCDLFLPYESRSKWCVKIVENPVLYKHKKIKFYLKL